MKPIDDFARLIFGIPQSKPVPQKVIILIVLGVIYLVAFFILLNNNL